MPRVLLALLLTLALGLSARAHDPQLSGVRFIVGSGTTLVSVMTHRSQLAPAHTATGAGGDDALLDRVVRQRLNVRLDGKVFTPDKASVLSDPANDLVMWQARYGKEAESVEVLARLYPEDPASKVVVSVVRGGATVQEILLDAAHPALVDSAAKPESGVTVALRFLREGVLHIFGGPDHLCFVLGLLLLGGGLKSLLKTVTAFTLAHSVTLTAAALGIWNPSPRLVEPLIALSILVIAFENLRRRSPETRDLRPWFAFGFGLIHGFGFAGALAEVGLPQQSLGAALAAFNLGVEAGQATIVLTVAPLLALLARARPLIHQRLVFGGSIAIGLAGLYWFVTRLMA